MSVRTIMDRPPASKSLMATGPGRSRSIVSRRIRPISIARTTRRFSTPRWFGTSRSWAGWLLARAKSDIVTRRRLAGASFATRTWSSTCARVPMPRSGCWRRSASGVRLINRPSSVLGCHRHRLVNILAHRRVAFPRTAVVATAGEPELDGFGADGRSVWVKRGDVHAECAADVVAVTRASCPAPSPPSAGVGFTRVALQEHVPGPVIKFYGVANGQFFRYYGADAGPDGPRPQVDEPRLRALAFAAAGELRLDVFGGDVAFPTPDEPVLIDLNDWPSFAPFRGGSRPSYRGICRSRMPIPLP